MDDGQNVGVIAHQYFDDIFVVENVPEKGKMIAATKAAIERGEANIAEATFSKGGCFCQVDILHRNDDGTWDIIEVKHNCNLKDYHWWDIAFQWHTLKLAGIPLGRAYLMHINNKYVREDELDVKQLFTLEDATDFCQDNNEKVVRHIDEARLALSATEEPKVEMGRQCEACWDCQYKSYCTSKLPEKQQAIFKAEGLTWLKKLSAAKTGTVPNNKEHIFWPDEKTTCDVDAIKDFVEQVYFPLYLLDFESVQQTIPQFRGQRPWQQTPFQYSLHIMKSWDEEVVEHREFIGDGITDPREQLIKQLLEDIPEGYQVMAYNDSFEKTILKLLAESFPEYADKLMEMRENFIDLMIPFRNRDYYKGSMRGSYSIKKVLPALFPEDKTLDYHNLEGVKNGTEAQKAYMALKDVTEEKREVLTKELLDYCKLDTFAMVRVLRFLHSLYADD